LADAAPTFAHQFDDSEQQHEASALGMWLFLVTEIMFFGGLFTGYTVFISRFHEAFTHASAHLDVELGATNTAVLLLSSLTMALAVRAAQTGERGGAIAGWLSATIALGCVFLGIKAIEYHEKFAHHLVPGFDFRYDGPDVPHARVFYSLYFAMTGVHALHMVIGIGLLLWLISQARRQRFSASYFTPVELCGLYWHFVDIVWIFLFPLLYLIGRR
jgi:cytochrome c oxidase subunit 3